MGKSKDLAELGDFGDVVHSVDADGNVVLRHDNTSHDSRLSVQQTDQRLDLGSYWEAGVAQHSYINTTNAAGTNAQSLQLRTGGTTRMTIDASGRVTMPYQPAFRAWKDATSWTVASTFVFDQTEYNVGGHYSTSTGRFTAPVTGVYHFDFYTIEYGNINNGYIRFWVNNARPYGGDVHFTTNEGSYWDYVGWHGDYKLNAGDYVEFITAQSHTYHGRNWSSFSGHLVG